jgi:hypothetical protein
MIDRMLKYVRSEFENHISDNPIRYVLSDEVEEPRQ